MNISNIIKEEYNKLGEGAYGKVFEKDGFAYKITTNLNEKKYAERIKEINNTLKAFPKIYYVKQPKSLPSYTFIKRDVLKLLKPNERTKIDAFRGYIKTYIHHDYDSLEYEDQKEQYRNSVEVINKNIKDPKLLEFFNNLKEDYKKIGIKKMLDIHGDNIGINKNGDYVLFDF